MQTDAKPLDLGRLETAKRVISQFGHHMTPEVREGILAQRVSIGMPPYEAYLAAGAFSFELKADPARWPAGADPYKVIQAQSLHPDDSEIWMFFSNATQFPAKGMMRFKIFVKGGKVREIQEL
jgi:hypothetical protein